MECFSLHFREQRAKWAYLYAHLATAARVKFRRNLTADSDLTDMSVAFRYYSARSVHLLRRPYENAAPVGICTAAEMEDT